MNITNTDLFYKGLHETYVHKISCMKCLLKLDWSLFWSKKKKV